MSVCLLPYMDACSIVLPTKDKLRFVWLTKPWKRQQCQSIPAAPILCMWLWLHVCGYEYDPSFAPDCSCKRWRVVIGCVHRCTVQRDRKISCCVYNSRLPLLKARSYSVSSFFLHSDVDCDRNIATLWTCLDVIKAIDCGRKRASPCVVMYGECFTRYCDQGSCYELCFMHFGVDIVCKYSKR